MPLLHEFAFCYLLETLKKAVREVLTRLLKLDCLLKLDTAWTLEEMWDKGKRAWSANDALGMTPEEAALGSTLSKLAFNVCLMATGQHGIGESGWTVSPHWRRGHWRWQPCGAGRVQR